MSEKASLKIHETAARMEPVTLGGNFSGRVMLTPRDVRTTKGPHFWEARAEVRADLGKGARSLYGAQWRPRQVLNPRRDKAHDLQVFEGALKFPDACPVNLETPDHYEVVEVPFGRLSASYTRRTKVNASREEANRMGVAVSSDRYWFAIPFSQDHGPDDRAVHFERVFSGEGESRTKVALTNREYARRFCTLNDLEGGRWLDSRHLIMQMVGLVALILSFGAVGGIVGSYLVLRGDSVQGDYWGAATIAVFVIGLVVLGVSIYLLMKGRKSEPI
jgi:hypothetical protein